MRRLTPTAFLAAAAVAAFVPTRGRRQAQKLWRIPVRWWEKGGVTPVDVVSRTGTLVRAYDPTVGHVVVIPAARLFSSRAAAKDAIRCLRLERMASRPVVPRKRQLRAR